MILFLFLKQIVLSLYTIDSSKVSYKLYIFFVVFFLFELQIYTLNHAVYIDELTITIYEY